jgi:hypothetical protein
MRHACALGRFGVEACPMLVLDQKHWSLFVSENFSNSKE